MFLNEVLLPYIKDNMVHLKPSLYNLWGGVTNNEVNAHSTVTISFFNRVSVKW